MGSSSASLAAEAWLVARLASHAHPQGLAEGGLQGDVQAEGHQRPGWCRGEEFSPSRVALWELLIHRKTLITNSRCMVLYTSCRLLGASCILKLIN